MSSLLNTIVEKDVSITMFANLSLTLNLSETNRGQLGYSCRNHPDNVLNLETFVKIDRMLYCGFLPSSFFVGAPTIIVTMIVFYRQGLRDRMNLCLFCLAFVDLMYVTAVFVSVLYCFVQMVLPSQGQFWRWTLLIRSLNITYASSHLSGCLTMIIAVERCVCVMFPMKAATLISTKTMAIILALTFLLIHGMCSVYAIKEKIIYIKDPVTGENIVGTSKTELYRSHDIFRIIENIVLSVVSFLCFIIVLTTTIITVVQLRHAIAWRKSTASGRSHLKGQAMLMRMLVAVSSIYLLCTVPNVVLSLTRYTVPEFRTDGAQCNLFFATHGGVLLISLLSSSINFFVYITMSSRFRQELKMSFPICSHSRKVK